MVEACPAVLLEAAREEAAAPALEVMPTDDCWTVVLLTKPLLAAARVLDTAETDTVEETKLLSLDELILPRAMEEKIAALLLVDARAPGLLDVGKARDDVSAGRNLLEGGKVVFILKLELVAAPVELTCGVVPSSDGE